MAVQFGSESCRDLTQAEKREWLVTNGIGGYASGTIAGTLTRAYHGLLVAALDPPAERTVLVSAIHETLLVAGTRTPLYSIRTSRTRISPHGYQYIQKFELEGTLPIWTFTVGDVLLKKRIWMQPGENTSYVRYEVINAPEGCELEYNILLNCRDHHGHTAQDDFKISALPVSPKEICFRIQEKPIEIWIKTDRGTLMQEEAWQDGFWLAVEDYRGLEQHESALLAASGRTWLEAGGSLTLMFSSGQSPDFNPERAHKELRAHQADVISRHPKPKTSLFDDEQVDQLVLAANQFIVDRQLSENKKTGKSVIAGYHWFGDWGRDTMIALPGLTLITGRPEITAMILRTFNQYLDQGMLPNRFPDIGKTPEYNTVDATLWYFEALRAYYKNTADLALIAEIYPSLEAILEWHQKGTRYNIKVDNKDGLIYAGAPNVQLTWMDAKVDDWVVTPREGKPVEINALWYNALNIMADFSERLGRESHRFRQQASRVAESFARFWNEEQGCLYDVLDSPSGNDPSIRPNQLFAVSLHYSPLAPTQQKAVVDCCRANLLTPHGLRSLSPTDPAYIGLYGGDRYARDGAYHQGTVWGWLIGPFIEAYLKVYRDPDAAESMLTPLLEQVSEFGLGSIGEIFDGDAPHQPRGCIAQAWSVAEVLRSITLIDNLLPDNEV